MSFPYPQITFRVVTVDYVQLNERLLPDDNPQNVIDQLAEATVWMPYYPWPLKNGEYFTLYGSEAVKLYQMIPQLNTTATLETIYIGPPIIQGEPPKYIALNTQQNMAVVPLFPATNGYDFQNTPATLTDINIGFTQTDSNPQLVFTTVTNNSSIPMIVNINGTIYTVTTGQTFNNTTLLNQNETVKITSQTSGIFTQGLVFGTVAVSPLPSPTATPLFSASPTPTPSGTEPTATPTQSPSNTPSPTPTKSPTPTPTGSPTITPSPTNSPSNSPSPTPSSTPIVQPQVIALGYNQGIEVYSFDAGSTYSLKNPGTMPWYDVTYNSDLDEWTAVTTSGKIFYSLDGVNWVQIFSNTNYSFRDVCFGYTSLSTPVTVVIDYNGNVTYSTDNRTWSTPVNLNIGNLKTCVYSNGNFVILPANGMKTMRSTNGVTWTAGANLPASGGWNGAASDPTTNRIVGLLYGSTTAVYSDNYGVSWTTTTLPTAATWENVVFTGSTFVAAASQGTPAVAVSSDGATWNSGIAPALMFALAEYAGKVIGYSYATSNSYTSADGGGTWIAVSLPATGNWVAAAGKNIITPPPTPVPTATITSTPLPTATTAATATPSPSATAATPTPSPTTAICLGLAIENNMTNTPISGGYSFVTLAMTPGDSATSAYDVFCSPTDVRIVGTAVGTATVYTIVGGVPTPYPFTNTSFDQIWTLNTGDQLAIYVMEPDSVNGTITYITTTPTPTASGATPTPSVTVSETPTPTASESPSPTPSNSPSPTPTDSPTPSPSMSNSPSPTPSDSPSPTPTDSPTPSPSPSPSPSESPTPSPSASLSPTPSPSPSPSESPTPSPSASLSPTPSPSPSPSATESPTPSPSPSPSVTASPTPSPSPSPSVTESPTPSPSPSPSVTASPTPSPSPSPSVTESPTPSPSPSPSESPTPSPSISPTTTASPTPSPSPSNSPSPTPSESPTPSPSISPTTTASPTPSPSPSESPTPSPSPSNSPSPTPSESPTPSPSISPTTTASPTPSPSPSESPTPSPSPSNSPSPTPSESPTPSPSISPTLTNSPTPSPSISPSVTPSPTPSPSAAPTQDLFVWGANSSGQLGLGNVVPRSSPTILTGANFQNIPYGANAIGALQVNGEMYVWGDNTFGQLGTNDTSNRNSPVILVGSFSQVSINSTSAGVRNDGTLWSWGNAATYGATALNTVSSNSSPLQIGSSNDWLKVVTRYSPNTLMAIKTDGTLWAAGNNANGCLGDGTTINRSSLVQSGTANNWQDIQVGVNFAVGLRKDGTIWTVGAGVSGNLGNNSITDRSSWIQVGSSNNWVAISCKHQPVLALNNLSELYVWGNGGTGGTGLNSVTSVSSPTLLMTNVAYFSAGPSFGSAIKNNNTLWTWGVGTNGRLGLNSIINVSSPTQVGTNASWIGVQSNFDTTMALYTYLTPVPTATSTLTPTATPSVTASPTPTPSNSESPTVTASPTPTSSVTASPTPTPSETISPFLCPADSMALGLTSVLNVNLVSNMQLGTSNFTIEWWQYLQTGGGTSPTVFAIGDSNSQVSLSLAHVLNGSFYDITLTINNASYVIGSVPEADLYRWVYMSLVRNSDVFTLYISGNAFGDAIENVDPITNSASVLGIGNQSATAGVYTFVGNITNFRWTVGTALYTSNYSIPSAPLSAVTGTTLLIDCQDSADVTKDTSGYNQTVNDTNVSYSTCAGVPPTATPAPSATPTILPIVCPGGAMSFTGGQNDYASMPSNSNLALGTGDYTIEFWCYYTSAGNLSPCYAFSMGAAGAFEVKFTSTPFLGGMFLNQLDYLYGGNTANIVAPFGAGFSFPDSWHYISISRNSGTLYYFLDGNLIGSVADSTNLTDTSTALVVGNNSTPSSGEVWNGRISNLRIIKGTGLYTSSYSRPNTPLTNVSGTVLLMTADNPMNVVADTSSVANVVTNNGVVYEACDGTTPTPTPTPSSTGATPTPTGTGATGTPTATPSFTPSPTPSVTPNPTATPVPAWFIWGNNQYGQAGNNSTNNISYLNVVQSANLYEKLTTGTTFQFLKTGYYSFYTGLNDKGQLGNNSTVNASSPIQMPAGNNWNYIGSAGGTSAATYNFQQLWTWGDNTYGQLGNNSTVSTSSPIQIGTNQGWNLPSIGDGFMEADKSGTPFVWGRNNVGQLGLGDTINRSSPVQLSNATTGSWYRVWLGRDFGVGMTSFSLINTWGANTYGQLGTNDTLNRSLPTLVFSGVDYAMVGQYHTLVLASDGTKWVWGRNDKGQLGLGDTVNRSSPTQLVANIVSYNIVGDTTYYIDSQQRLWGVGSAADGLLLNYTTNQSSPVQLGVGYAWYDFGYVVRNNGWDGKTAYAKGSGYPQKTPTPTASPSPSATDPTATPTPTPSGSPSPTPSPSPSPSPTPSESPSPTPSPSPSPSPSVTPSPTPSPTPTPTLTPIFMWTFGQNNTGQLGLNNVVNRSSPVFMGSKSWYSLPSSAYASVVEDTDGYLYAWGSYIGDSTTIVRSSPTQITAYPQYSVFKVLAGAVAAALRTNGTLWIMGNGAQGSLGNNTTANVSSPVQAFGSYVDFWIPKAGNGNVFAIDSSNVLWGWGPNTAGELGVTPLVNASSPIIISTGISWTQFVGGSNFNLGLRSDGTLWSTGVGANGVTGQNNIINRSSWTQIGTQSNWTQIAANANNSGGIKADNTLWMWGNGFGGVLGNNTVVSRSSPNQVAGTNWTKVGIGTQHVNALKADGSFWGWGNNSNGQLGRNNVVTTSSPVQTVIADTSWLDFDTGATFVMAQRVPPPTASPTPAPTPVPIAGLSCPYGAQTYQNNALTVSNGGDYAVGTGDFTIEWFQNTTAGSTLFGSNLSQYIFSINDNKFAFTEYIPGPYIDPQYIQWDLYVNDTLYTLYNYNFVFEQTSPYGIWLHIALVRASGVVTLYINGVAYGTANVSANMTDTSTLYIGDRTTHDSGSFYNYYGLLTNFRFVKGTAIYTSNFTPPSAPLSNVTNCTLLMQVNSSGTILTDSSSLGKTVTNTLGTVTYTSC